MNERACLFGQNILREFVNAAIMAVPTRAAGSLHDAVHRSAPELLACSACVLCSVQMANDKNYAFVEFHTSEDAVSRWFCSITVVLISFV